MYQEPIINIKEKDYVTSLNCELVSNEDVSHLEGKLKTLVDALGLPEKQEKALKDQTNTILWDWYCFLRDHYLDHLTEKIDWYWEKKIKKDKYYLRK